MMYDLELKIKFRKIKRRKSSDLDVAKPLKLEFKSLNAIEVQNNDKLEVVSFKSHNSVEDDEDSSRAENARITELVTQISSLKVQVDELPNKFNQVNF